MINPRNGKRTRTTSTAVATIATFAIWAGTMSSASAALEEDFAELRASGMSGCTAVQTLVERDPRATYQIAEIATRNGMPQRDSIDCAANKYAELLAAGAIPNQSTGTASDVVAPDSGSIGTYSTAGASNNLQDEFRRLTDSGLTGCAAIQSMVVSNPAALYEIAGAGASAGMSEQESVGCATNKYNELAAAGAIPQYTTASEAAASGGATGGGTSGASGSPAAAGGIQQELNELMSGGMDGCTAIGVMVESNPNAVYGIADAGVRSGMSRQDSIDCAANKYAELLAVGAIPQATAAGPGTPTGGPVADAGTPANTLGNSPQAPNLGDSPIEQEFQFLVDITRASGYDEGTIGCPAIELMVRNNPTQIDEIVDVAARAGIPEDDSIECAARELAAIGPTAPAGGPIPGDPPAFVPDPPLGEPKIIRPPDPPTGPPGAASPT